MTTIQQMLLVQNNTYYSPYMDVVGDLYDFSTFTFTPMGATGRNGPTTVENTVASQVWFPTYYSLSAGIQYWYAPTTGSYTIRAAGAAGHDGFYADKCRGIIIESTLTLTKGMLYKIIVGQKGVYYSTYGSGGGGGGTFLSEFYNLPVIVSGGGGGCMYTNNNTTIVNNVNDSIAPNSDGQSTTSGGYSTNGGFGVGGYDGGGGTGGTGSSWGSGGGGFYSNGTAASQASGYGYSGLGFSFINGGTGGDTATSSVGGFGGGAGTHGNTGGGGGGGGYSGGGGSGYNAFYSPAKTWGGGGGSYSQSQIAVIGYNTGQGYLIITKN